MVPILQNQKRNLQQKQDDQLLFWNFSKKRGKAKGGKAFFFTAKNAKEGKRLYIMPFFACFVYFTGKKIFCRSLFHKGFCSTPGISCHNGCHRILLPCFSRPPFSLFVFVFFHNFLRNYVFLYVLKKP